MGGLALLATQFAVYAARTGSMQPSIPPRSAVVVEPSRSTWQVITFVHRGEVITHRLIAKDATGRLMTRGDANERPDPWQLRRTDVMGGVVAAPRSLGYWLVYFRTVRGSRLRGLRCAEHLAGVHRGYGVPRRGRRRRQPAVLTTGPHPWWADPCHHAG